MDDRAQCTFDRTREDGDGLALASLTTTQLATRLVEPGLDARLPAALSEVAVGNNVVSARHLYF
jgi:hypothetical protein